MRIVVALSIISGGVVIGFPLLVIAMKRRRRDKLRRRGIKDYNRSTKPARN